MTFQNKYKVISLGTGIRKQERIYHYMCMKCGLSFNSYKRGNYHHGCSA